MLAINSTFVAASDSSSKIPPLDLVNGNLPLLVFPDAKKILQIGVGSGMTTDVLVEYPIKKLTTVEICPSVVRATSFFNKNDWKNDPRVKVIINDARNHLFIDTTSYDIIIDEAWFSIVTGTTPLTSKEYFLLAKSRLKPDGIYCAGAGLLDNYFNIVVRTMQSVFEHVHFFTFVDTGCFFAVASKKPLILDYKKLASLFKQPKIKRQLARISLHKPEDFLANFICGSKGVREYLGKGPINTDNLHVTTYDIPSLLCLDLYNPYHLKVAADKIHKLLQTFETPLLKNVSESQIAHIKRAQEALKKVLIGKFIAKTKKQKILNYKKALQLNPQCIYAQNFLKQNN